MCNLLDPTSDGANKRFVANTGLLGLSGYVNANVTVQVIADPGSGHGLTTADVLSILGDALAGLRDATGATTDGTADVTAEASSYDDGLVIP